MCLNATVPKLFCEEAGGAACIENLSGCEPQYDGVSYGFEKVGPFRGRTRMRRIVTVNSVVFVVKNLAGAPQSRGHGASVSCTGDSTVPNRPSVETKSSGAAVGRNRTVWIRYPLHTGKCNVERRYRLQTLPTEKRQSGVIRSLPKVRIGDRPCRRGSRGCSWPRGSPVRRWLVWSRTYGHKFRAKRSKSACWGPFPAPRPSG